MRSLLRTVVLAGRSPSLLAAAAGIRAPMLAGAVPMAMVTVFTGWRHRASGQ